MQSPYPLDLIEVYKALYDKSIEGLLVINKDHTIQFSNPTAEYLLGYEKGSLRDVNIRAVVEPSFAKSIHEGIDNTFKYPHENRLIEGLFLKKNGSKVEIELELYNSLHSNEGPILILLFNDIGKRREIERETQKNLTALKLLNAVSQQLWSIKDLQVGLDAMLHATTDIMGTKLGNIQLYDAEKKVLNIRSQKGFKKDFLDFFKEVSVGDNCACGTALRNHAPVIVEDTELDENYAPYREIARSAGYRAVISVPLFGKEDSPMGMISVHFDKPHRPGESELQMFELYAQQATVFIKRCLLDQKEKNLMNELEERVKERTLKLTESLEREKIGNKLKSRFVSTASHEFRTPLAAILSSISLVEKYMESKREDMAVKHLERVKSSIYHLTDILNDFLTLDNLEYGTSKVINSSFNLTSFIQDVINEMGPLLKKGQQINYISIPDVQAYQDKKILRNILTNVISNAIKYSDTHKQIIVKLTPDESSVNIEVKDEGRGIPYEDQQHMFSKLFRAGNSSDVPGSGLGLNIVKMYLEVINGGITFKSEPEKGTTFYLKFPLFADN